MQELTVGSQSVVKSSSPNSIYVPEKGDIVWIDFNPQSGREQAGRRPALVVSPTPYNRRVKLAIVCPITTKVKGYPFEIALPDTLLVHGVVLADQVKSLDFRTCKAELACKLPDEVLVQVVARIANLPVNET
ncbi:MAG: endoribonuclease MazF [Spirulinaceae cyanobacterium RM2_2_10]|nr:endoribonuclease MazF [Spirulinaceae cyanobacterium SM2_1_0]NJO18899.1 endoribonuclease MazF [Spirulinaceae cyanobacterium RM2_2_10]